MSNTFRRIYKQNLLLADHGYPSAPEHQSSQSENTPDSPVKSCLYAELDGSSQARSVIVPIQQQISSEYIDFSCTIFSLLNLLLTEQHIKYPSPSIGKTSKCSSMTMENSPATDSHVTPITTKTANNNGSGIAEPITMNVGAPIIPSAAVTTTTATVTTPILTHKKVRHRRMGSADNNYSYILPALPIDRRNIKMVHSETQTDSLDVTSMDCSPCPTLASRELNTTLDDVSRPSSIIVTDDNQHESSESDNDQMKATDSRNDNSSCQCELSPCGDTVDHAAAHSCSPSNEQRIYDYMNSNEQLDIRESSDEDNVETLNRRVSQFFNENRLLSNVAENGNGSMIDSRRLFNVMAARRSCISINDKDEVIVMSRPSSFRTNGSIHAHTDTMSRRNSSSAYKISDHNCNNDDGDDSWTDEEGEESDRAYALRRKW